MLAPVRRLRCALLLVALSMGSAGCEGTDAARVALPLVVDGTEAREVVTADGWSVALDEARLAIADVRLRRGGEEHASWLTPLSRWLIPSAHAHPGHTVGGDVVGEALGRYRIDLLADDEEPFAEASVLVTDASALDFTFAPLDDSDLPAHSARFAGTATRGDEVVRFEALVTQDEGRRVEGVPLSLDVTERPAALTFGLRLARESGETLFDDVDFATLPYPRADDVARVEAGTPAHNRVRNALQSHEHYRTTVRSREVP